MERFLLKRERLSLAIGLLLLFVAGCSNPQEKVQQQQPVAEKQQLIAKSYFSGFDLAHDTYNAISPASDGRIYYCLSSNSIDIAGQLYAYDQ